MFEFISIFRARLRQPKTLSDALKQLVSSAVVDAAVSETYTANLIEAVAQDLALDPTKLLRDVGRRIGLCIMSDPAVPTEETVRQSGHDPETLRSLGALVQPSPTTSSGYALVVANPDAVSIEEFHSQGVPVLLSLGSRIEDRWRRFYSDRDKEGEIFSDAQLMAVLKRTACDADKLGAQAVFIGYPSDDSYEFLAGEQKYAGKLHPQIYSRLVEVLSKQGIIEEEAGEESITSLSVSLTRSFFRPIICLTWHSSLSLPERECGDSKVQAAEEGAAQPSADSQPLIAQANPDEREKSVSAAIGSRILIIDDDPCFCFILEKILQSKGLDPMFRYDSESALSLLIDKEYLADLIICDVHMPNVDSAELVRRLRERSPAIPLLMLTSDEDQLIEAELALHGIDAFIRKRDDPRVLLAWIANLLKRRDKTLEALR